MMKRKLINILALFFFFTSSYAQIEGYKYHAMLDSITKSGFYNIILSPEVNAHLKADYSDVRIVNSSGKWIPHSLHVPANDITRHSANYNLKYLVLESNRISTNLIISAFTSLNNIVLTIRNASAERFCSISGSDDKINWFVINDSILINPMPTESSNNNNFRLDFPQSNYKFYKISIVNNNKAPFDIKGIATNDLIGEPLIKKYKVIKNPSSTITQKDSGKISYIKVNQQLPYHFDAINIKVSAVKYFVRKLEIFAPENARHNFNNPGKLVHSYIFSNRSNLDFKTPLINDSVFYILIYNDDNLPLKIDEVTTTVNEHFLKAYLEVGKNYKLIMGNENATIPNFDIDKLNITTNDSAGFIEPKNIIAYTHQKHESISPKNKTKWILWIALFLGLIILLMLSIKMIKEINKKTTNDTI